MELLENQIRKFDSYLKVEKKYSIHTCTAYSHDITTFINYTKDTFGITSITEVSHFFIREWVVILSNENISPRAINRKISSLSTFFNYLKKNKIIDLNPTSKVNKLKVEKKLPDVVKTSEIKKIFQVPKEDTFELQRDRLMIELLYTCGLRRSELMNIQRNDINFERYELKILGKGNKFRIIPLSSELILHLQSYISIRNKLISVEHNYLLILKNGKNIYEKFIHNTVKKYLSLYTTSSSQNPHVLRHSFATHLSDNGAELEAIRMLLGHSSLSATQVYMHNSISKLKEIYHNTHPKS